MVLHLPGTGHCYRETQSAFPANTPVYFKVTSNSVMNSFFIPRLGSAPTMARMQTRLHLIAN